jgi:hypothetical protein
MPHRGRILLGFALVAPMAVLIAMATYELLWHGGFLPQGAPIHSVDAAQAMFGGLTIIAVPMTLIGAVPGVLWLNRKGWLTFGRLVALGAVLGNLPFMLIVGGIVVVQLGLGTPVAEIGRYWEGLAGFLVRTAMGVIAGAGAAVTFWLVGVCGTPNAGRSASRPVNAP